MSGRRGEGGAAGGARRLGGILRSEAGVSAVEFALFAPLLFFAAVAMVDIGLAVRDRMAMDRLVRGGAQSAMQDPGADRVRTVIEASAEARFEPGTDFTLSVERNCTCSASGSGPAPCDSTCDDANADAVHYRIVASRSYPALILPDIGLEARAEVQVR